MLRIKRSALLVLAASVAACEGSHDPAAESTDLATDVAARRGYRAGYRAIDIGISGQFDYATGINDVGSVLILSFGSPDATVRRPGGSLIPVAGLPGGSGVSGSAINNREQVVGFAYDREAQAHAILWSEAFGTLDLGTLGGGTSQATAVNNRGQVVGFSDVTNLTFREHAFLWAPGEGMVDLTKESTLSSRAYDINDRGQVVGEWAGVAFLWSRAGGLVELRVPNATTGARAINNRGEVVGSISYLATGETHPFLWTAATGMIDLGVPFGARDAGALAINDSGLIVGVASLPTTNRAFLRLLDGTFVDLPELDKGLSEAVAINACAQIVGRAGNDAVLWTKPCGR